MKVRKRDQCLVGPSSGQMIGRYISNNAYKSTSHHTPEDPKDRPGHRIIETISENRKYKETFFSEYTCTNDVTHSVQNIEWYSWRGQKYFGTTYYYTFEGCMFLDRSPYRVYATDLNLSSKPPESFNSRAFQAMYPDLETSLSLSNFVIELRDMKRLFSFFKEWKGKRQALQRLAKKYKYASSLRKQGTARPDGKLTTATKFAANAHLSYKFGVVPFVGDVIKLIESLTDYQRRIDNFLARRDLTQKRRYSEKEPWSVEISAWTKWQGSSTCYYRYRTGTSIRDTATMTYTYSCPDLNTFSLKLKAIRDMLGLRLTPSVIWESIPFSFVVDWFFRVQDFLKANEDPLIKAKVTVLDYSISRKLTYSCQREWKFWGAPNGSKWAYHTDADHYGSTYTRRRVPPDADQTFIDRGQYGLTQLALSLSLLRANVR